MPLTTIDGMLYLPDVEYNFLASMELHNELDRQWPEWLAGHDAALELSYEMGIYQDIARWPLDYLIKQIRRQVQQRQRAYGDKEHRICQVGEEDLNGRIYGSPESPVTPGRTPPYADYGLVGPASLIGKIALELARRLEVEIDGDAMAASTAWQPKAWEEDTHDPPTSD